MRAAICISLPIILTTTLSPYDLAIFDQLIYSELSPQLLTLF